MADVLLFRNMYIKTLRMFCYSNLCNIQKQTTYKQCQAAGDINVVV